MHSPSLKANVAVGISIACVAYALSLGLQRRFPPIREALELTLADGIKPTYYLRVVIAVTIGFVAATLTPRRAVSEEALAWGMTFAICVSVVLISAFP
jgi:hypothetical protein